MLFNIILIFLLIFVVNLIPAFTPPTWLIISFTAFSFELNNYQLLVFSIIGAILATSGRSVLALFSSRIIRYKVISEKARNNIDELKNHLETKKGLISLIFLGYAFSPLPSGQLFLAYGLANLKLRLAIIPFLIGRVFVYSFFALSASKISESIDLQNLSIAKIFSTYFVVAQILALLVVYLFVKIDWKKIFIEKKFGFINEKNKNE